MTLLGLDLGTSSFKMSAYSDRGRHLGTVSRPTPWQRMSTGLELSAEAFVLELRAILADVVARYSPGPVGAIGVTGMAETIFVEDQGGDLLPARAWHHRSGPAPELPEASDLEVTGLLDGRRTPAVAMRALAGEGVEVRSWRGLPEYAVEVLGGVRVAERSLASRTGLVDVHTGDWSPTLLAWAGVESNSRPELSPAGSSSSQASWPPECVGATLTVAGHDHLVAAVGAGAYDERTLFDSLGTGEAVLAPIGGSSGTLDRDAAAPFRAADFNVGLGVGDADAVALAGLGTGGRFTLLLAALERGGFPTDEVVEASGRETDETLRATERMRACGDELLTVLFGPTWQSPDVVDEADRLVREAVPDLASARALWWAAVERAAQRTRASVDALAHLLPGVTQRVAAGGWLGNAGIRDVRERVLGRFQRPDADQCGTRGAVLLAGLAAGLFAREDFPALANESGGGS